MMNAAVWKPRNRNQDAPSPNTRSRMREWMPSAPMSTSERMDLACAQVHFDRAYRRTHLSHCAVEADLYRRRQLAKHCALQIAPQQAEQAAFEHRQQRSVWEPRARAPGGADPAHGLELEAHLTQRGQQPHAFCGLEAGTEQVDDVAFVVERRRRLNDCHLPAGLRKTRREGETRNSSSADDGVHRCGSASDVPGVRANPWRGQYATHPPD